MTEQRDDRRRRPTRNAGAFFSPTRGPTPVPMDIDRYWDRLPVKRSWARLARTVIVMIIIAAVVLAILWLLTPANASALAATPA